MLFVVVEHLVEVAVEVDVDGGELDVAACFDALGGVEEFGDGDFVESGGGAFHKRRDEVAGISGTVYVDAHAKHGCGVEHGVDSGL